MLILHAKFANRRCLPPALRAGNQNTTNNSIQRTLRWHWCLLLGRASGRSSRGLRTASALSELNESLACSGPARSLLRGLCNFPSESLGFLLGWSWCSECVVSWLPDRWHVRGALHRLVLTDPCQCPRLNARWVSQKEGFPSRGIPGHCLFPIIRCLCQLNSLQSFPRIDRR